MEGIYRDFKASNMFVERENRRIGVIQSVASIPHYKSCKKRRMERLFKADGTTGHLALRDRYP